MTTQVSQEVVNTHYRGSKALAVKSAAARRVAKGQLAGGPSIVTILTATTVLSASTQLGA